MCHSIYLQKRRESRKSDRYKKQRKEWLDKNPKYKLLKNLRAKHNNFVRYNIKNNLNYSTTKALGCTSQEFKTYIESLFTSNMNWKNYGTFWVMDHIFPLARIDLNNTEELELATHFLNIQPLPIKENMEKSDKILINKEEHFNKIRKYKNGSSSV